MISFENVSKKYGRTVVLDKLNLQISTGEFVSVIGPSGAGKSTLVYILMGAEKIEHGKIIVDGYTINTMDDRELQFFRRRIGVVFQDYKLLPQKTVYENVAFAMEVCGYEDSEIKKRVPEILEYVGLTEFAKRFPSQLSGGERQRTAIARALVHHPRLIVADEPTGNLDPKTGKEIIELLLKINKDGITVILTTHNVALVDLIKKRVVKIAGGKVTSDLQQSGYHTQAKQIHLAIS
ncbi:MAG: cell division ATP-binding protein FtsE [Candidatus Gracilibacteria bacterium]|jgi:cell division transport system ATP-binding protein